MSNNAERRDINVDLEIAKSHLSAAGWKLGAFNNSTVFDSHFFYLRDFRIDKIHIVSVSYSDFNSTPGHIISMGQLTVEIGQILKNAAPSDSLDSEAGLALGPLLVSYLKGTKSYLVWQQMNGGDRIHALINVYEDIYKEAVLRPVLFRCESLVMDCNKVLDVSGDVFRMDKKSHPEWFC